MALLTAYPSQLLLTFCLAALTTLAAIAPVRSLAYRWQALDRPSPRREATLKPRLGGLALFPAFTLTILLMGPWVQERTPEEWQRIAALLLGGAIVVGVGLVDDRRELGPLPQLVAQTAAAAIAIAGGITITAVPNPFGTTVSNSLWALPPGVAELVTLLWMVGVMNAMNFLDGLDGLAAGIGTIAAGVLVIHSLLLGQMTIALLPVALIGATLGFLPFNLAPARITLGTSGAVFLGYTLAALAVIGGTKAATALLVLGLPILDALFIILRRLARGQRPWEGDRTHLHHLLQQVGLSPRTIVLLFWGAALLFGVLALVLSARLYKLYALGGLALLVAGGLLLLAQIQPRSR